MIIFVLSLLDAAQQRRDRLELARQLPSGAAQATRRRGRLGDSSSSLKFLEVELAAPSTSMNAITVSICSSSAGRADARSISSGRPIWRRRPPSPAAACSARARAGSSAPRACRMRARAGICGCARSRSAAGLGGSAASSSRPPPPSPIALSSSPRRRPRLGPRAAGSCSGAGSAAATGSERERSMCINELRFFGAGSGGRGAMRWRRG